MSGFGLRTTFGMALVLLFGLPAAQAAESLDELDERLRVVERKLSGKTLTEMVNNLRSTRESVDELRGDIESMKRKLNKLEERQREMYSELDGRLHELETSQRNDQQADPDDDGSPEGGNNGDGSDGGSNGAGSQAASEKRYNEAFETLRSGSYEAAREQFQALLEDDPDGEFADNAQYWIGESHYVVREFDKARQAFKKVLNSYPKSAKRPDALLKLGFIAYEQGNSQTARETLNRVIEEYPNTRAEKQARKRLERMRN